MDTGKKIALCRKESGMSQEALAAEMGISRQAVSRWETGEALPDTAKIILLARLFNVSCDYLLLDEVELKDGYTAQTKGDFPLAASPVAERRRRFRMAFGVAATVLGIICACFALIYAAYWADNTDWWYTGWGAFGTALFCTGIVVPFVLGIALLLVGGLSLVREYIRED